MMIKNEILYPLVSFIIFATSRPIPTFIHCDTYGILFYIGDNIYDAFFRRMPSQLFMPSLKSLATERNGGQDSRLNIGKEKLYSFLFCKLQSV